MHSFRYLVHALGFLLMQCMVSSVIGIPADPDYAWLMDDGSGITATAAYGGQNGTLTNGPTWNTSVRKFNYTGNQTVQFDGGNDYIDVSGLNNTLELNAVSWSFWIYSDSASIKDEAFFTGANNAGGGSDNWGARYDSNGFSGPTDRMFKFSMGIGGSNYVYESDTDSAAVGVWKHVVMVWDGAGSNGFSVYIDGSLDSPGANTFPTTGTISGQDQFWLGTGPKAYFDGYIDEVAVWTSALSASDADWLSTHSIRNIGFSWDGSQNALFSQANNWTGSTTPGAGDDVLFSDDYGTGAESVTVNGNESVGSMTFDNLSAYTISGNGSITMDTSGAGASDITVSSHAGTPGGAITHTIEPDLALSNDLAIDNYGTNTSLTISGDIDTNGNDISLSGTANVTLSGVISEGGALTQSGTGTTTLSGTGANTFTGIVTVNAGNLSLNKTAGTDAIANTTINLNGGSVTLLAANQINNNADMTLNGGTLDINGNADTLDNLTLDASSVIDFGSGEVDLTFDDLTINSGTLSIHNWTGSWTRDGVAGVSDGSVDRLLFANTGSYSAGDYVSNVRFYSDDGSTVLGTQGRFVNAAEGGGLLELVPVPEPGAMGALIGMSLIALVYSRKRKIRL